VKQRLSVALVVAAVCGAAAACALAAVPAKVGTLRFSYPARFEHLDLGSAVIVADYPLSKDSPTVRTATFPANGVVFELLHEQHLDHPIPAAPVRFPVLLDRLGRSTRHTNGQTWELRFSVGGNADDVYWVVVWFGDRASAADRAAVASMVRSVRSG
jgi:hypothetical protein